MHVEVLVTGCAAAPTIAGPRPPPRATTRPPPSPEQIDEPPSHHERRLGDRGRRSGARRTGAGPHRPGPSRAITPIPAKPRAFPAIKAQR